MASVPTSYYLMWHYNCLWSLKRYCRRTRSDSAWSAVPLSPSLYGCVCPRVAGRRTAEIDASGQQEDSIYIHHRSSYCTISLISSCRSPPASASAWHRTIIVGQATSVDRLTSGQQTLVHYVPRHATPVSPVQSIHHCYTDTRQSTNPARSLHHMKHRTFLSTSSQSCHHARTRTKLGDRAFSVAGPHTRNRLPPSLRLIDSHAQFHKQLKADLFKLAFD